MKKIFYSLSSIILCTAIVCNAAPLTDHHVKVAAQGVADVAAIFGKNRISAKITTHEVDIGKPSDLLPQKKLTNCTYSRIPCSIVDHLELSVNGNVLFVVRSAYADLADISVASLRQKKNAQFILTLSGGDASESYTVEITFDKDLVRQRELLSDLNGQVMERTTYFASQSMD